MKKILSGIIAIFAFSSVSFAETVNKSEQFSTFSSIEVHDGFEVSIQSGMSYDVQLTVDKRVADYCRMYVQGSTLVMELDEKSYPKELKKQLRQKDAAPLILVANISMPVTSGLQSINLKDKAILASVTDFNLPRQLELITEDNSSIKSFDVKAPKVIITSSKKSSVVANVNASELDVNAKNNAVVNVTMNGATFDSVSENSSQLTVNGTVSDANIRTANQASVRLVAKIENLNVTGKNSSNIDANASDINTADIDLNSASCTVSPAKSLKISLSSGAKLTFGGAPTVDIRKIEKSSVFRTNN